MGRSPFLTAHVGVANFKSRYITLLDVQMRVRLVAKKHWRPGSG